MVPEVRRTAVKARYNGFTLPTPSLCKLLGWELNQPRVRGEIRWLRLFKNNPESPRTSTSSTQTLADQIADFEGALTAKDLARLLSISAVTVFILAKRGALPSFRIGGCVRFCPTAISRWLRARGA
jgi:excisionase family DNA binding protein